MSFTDKSLKKIEKRKGIFSIALFLLLLIFCGNSTVYAAEAVIAFGEESYSIEEESFEIEVSIKADGNIGIYEINLLYDKERMEYISGAERESDGVITLEGTGFGDEVAYVLEFKAIGAGTAGLIVQDAWIYSASDEAISYTISSFASVPVNIQGEDGGELSFFERLNEGEQLTNPGGEYNLDVPVIGSIVDGNGKVLYIVDMADYEPDIVLWDYKLVTGSYQNVNFTYISDQGRNVRVILLIDNNGNYYPYAYVAETDSFYPVDEIATEEGAYHIISLSACMNIPGGISEEERSTGTVFYAIHENGAGGYYRYTTAGNLDEWRQGKDGNWEVAGGELVYLILIVLFVFIVGLLVLVSVMFRKKGGRKDSKKQVISLTEYFNDKKKYLFVIKELTSREIKRKYARSHLGIVWSVLNPLLMMIVMSMIFSYMFKRSIDNYPLYYLTGSLFWNLFCDSTEHAMSALVDNKSLLVKAKLPRQTFAASRMLTALVNFGYSCIPYALILLVFGIRPSWTMLLLPFDIILCFAFSMGIGYVLSILYVFFADIKYLYSVFLRILLYLTALFYPVTSLPEVLQRVIGYNPVYLSIYIARECMVYGNVPHYSAWLKLIIYTVVSCTAGWVVFRKKQNDVMQRI